MKWILERAKEKTTWLGIIGVIGTLTGAQLAPELQEAITTTGLAITSLVLILLKEKK